MASVHTHCGWELATYEATAQAQLVPSDEKIRERKGRTDAFAERIWSASVTVYTVALMRPVELDAEVADKAHSTDIARSDKR